MSMTIAEALFEEGRIEGALKGKREMISHAALVKFGQELPLHLKQKLEQCTDHDRLESFLFEIVDSNSMASLHF